MARARDTDVASAAPRVIATDRQFSAAETTAAPADLMTVSRETTDDPTLTAIAFTYANAAIAATAIVAVTNTDRLTAFARTIAAAAAMDRIEEIDRASATDVARLARDTKPATRKPPATVATEAAKYREAPANFATLIALDTERATERAFVTIAAADVAIETALPGSFVTAASADTEDARVSTADSNFEHAAEIETLAALVAARFTAGAALAVTAAFFACALAFATAAATATDIDFRNARDATAVVEVAAATFRENEVERTDETAPAAPINSWRAAAAPR